MIEAYLVLAQSSAERRGQLIGFLLASILIFAIGFALLKFGKRKK